MALSSTPITGQLEIEASAGAYRAWPFTITNVNGQPVTGWTSNDAITVQVWQGDNLEELDNAGVSATWVDAPNGLLRIVTDGTHELVSSTYKFRLLAVNVGLSYELIRGGYKVLQAPGEARSRLSAKERPYTTIDDLRTIAPWIEQLQSQFDQSGLMEHQIAARQWFDNCVKRAWNSSRGYSFRNYSQPDMLFEYELNQVPTWLETVVNSGTGILISPAIRRACALYACYSACMAQVSVKDDASHYRKKAAEFRAMAANELAVMQVRVKSSLTSLAYDVIINLNISTRN